MAASEREKRLEAENERLRRIVAHVAGGVAVQGDRAQYKDPDATHRMAPTAWVAFDTRTKVAAIQFIREARALIATPEPPEEPAPPETEGGEGPWREVYASVRELLGRDLRHPEREAAREAMKATLRARLSRTPTASEPDHCPTCGGPVEIESSDEETSCYRPAPTASPEPQWIEDNLRAFANAAERGSDVSLVAASQEVRDAVVRRLRSAPTASPGRIDGNGRDLLRTYLRDWPHGMKEWTPEDEANRIADALEEHIVGPARRVSREELAHVVDAILRAHDPMTPPTEADVDDAIVRLEDVPGIEIEGEEGNDADTP